jgi:DNA-binding GntR family transcriptional regulator
VISEPTPSTDSPGHTLAERAYAAIRDAVAARKLRPGQKVTERGLAEKLDMSPTPVREAIRRLEQDGLLERTGPRTVKVSAIGDRAVQDLIEVEVALRGMVARFAARHARPEQLDELDHLLDEADDLLIVIRQRHKDGEDITRLLNRLLDTIQRFNDTVEAGADNPVLVRLLEQSRVFSQPERRARILERTSYDESFGMARWRSHRQLVDALRRRDAEAAEAIAIADASGGLHDLLDEPPLAGPHRSRELAHD